MPGAVQLVEPCDREGRRVPDVVQPRRGKQQVRVLAQDGRERACGSSDATGVHPAPRERFTQQMAGDRFGPVGERHDHDVMPGARGRSPARWDVPGRLAASQNQRSAMRDRNVLVQQLPLARPHTVGSVRCAGTSWRAGNDPDSDLHDLRVLNWLIRWTSSAQDEAGNERVARVDGEDVLAGHIRHPRDLGNHGGSAVDGTTRAPGSECPQWIHGSGSVPASSLPEACSAASRAHVPRAARRAVDLAVGEYGDVALVQVPGVIASEVIEDDRAVDAAQPGIGQNAGRMGNRRAPT